MMVKLRVLPLGISLRENLSAVVALRRWRKATTLPVGGCVLR